MIEHKCTHEIYISMRYKSTKIYVEFDLTHKLHFIRKIDKENKFK